MNGDYIITVTNTSFWDLNNVVVSCRTGVTAPPSWGGYTDGRLNPEMAENYSLWCAWDFLDVYRAPDGVGQLIASVALSDILNIDLGHSQSFGTTAGPITIIRDTVDSLRVTGHNGTNAPAWAEKMFTLTECGLRNGGLPPVADADVPQVSAAPGSYASSTGDGLVSLEGSLVSVLLQLDPPDPDRDRDGDAVPDYRDACPDVYAPLPLQFGCPDRDGDGLSDPLDVCPYAAGDIQGCPDTDGDGLSDLFDMCPNFKPPADKPSVYGCLDSDGDGFPNGTLPNGQWMDWCPLAGKEPGIAIWMGCPDPDEDGFIGGNRPGVPSIYRDDCPENSTVWYANGEPCPPPTFVPRPPPVVDEVPFLFRFAAQQGAFDNLYLEAPDGTQVCIGTMGFCTQYD